MSGTTTSSISITISAADLASAKFDALAARIAALQKPVAATSKTLGALGDTVPLTKLTGAMKTFGDSALGTARAVERIAGPMAALTSIGTISGMIALSRAWSEMGNTVLKTATALEMPVQQLSRMQIGAKIAGSSAEAMTKTLGGLWQASKDVQFGRFNPAIPALAPLGVKLVDDKGVARNPADVLRDITKAMETKGYDAHARATLYSQIPGADADIDPMIGKGLAHYEEELARADKTLGPLTEHQAEMSRQLKGALEELSATLGGVVNVVMEKWTPAIVSLIEHTDDWIQKNQMLTASIVAIGTASSTTLAAIAWMFGAPAAAGTAAVAGTAAAVAIGFNEADKEGQRQAAAGRVGLSPAMINENGQAFGYRDAAGNLYTNDEAEQLSDPRNRSYNEGRVPTPTPGAAPVTTLPAGAGSHTLGGGRGPIFGSQGGGAGPGLPIIGLTPGSPTFSDGTSLPGPRLSNLPRGIRNFNPGNLNFASQPGATLEYPGGRFARFRTMDEGIAALGSQLQRYQDNWHKDTIRDIINTYAPGSENDTAGYVRNMVRSTGFDPDQHLNMHDPETLAKMERGIIAMENGPGYANVAGSGGTVHVTVDLHGAPTGTTATATAAGAATTAPPRVEHAMAGV